MGGHTVLTMDKEALITRNPFIRACEGLGGPEELVLGGT
jgi:hypothetical protein